MGMKNTVKRHRLRILRVKEVLLRDLHVLYVFLLLTIDFGISSLFDALLDELGLPYSVLAIIQNGIEI